MGNYQFLLSDQGSVARQYSKKPMTDDASPAGARSQIVTGQITIIGVGLIGGSFALALRAAGLDSRFIAYGRNEETLRRAVELKIVDDYSTSIADATAGSDLILLAAPVGANDAILDALAEHVDPNTVITDVGSVKQSVIETARSRLPSLERFVPAHPIAGTEHSGVEAGFTTLFQDKRLIITPLPETAADAIERVTQLWAMTGAKIEIMDPRRHDQVFAATSHLPHVLAFTLVETLHRMEQNEALLKYASGGFSDFTRIASSDPVMWRDICLHNSESLLAAIGGLQEGLDTLIEAIHQQDGAKIQQLFKIAKETRDLKILNATQEPE